MRRLNRPRAGVELLGYEPRKPSRHNLCSCRWQHGRQAFGLGSCLLVRPKARHLGRPLGLDTVTDRSRLCHGSGYDRSVAVLNSFFLRSSRISNAFARIETLLWLSVSKRFWLGIHGLGRRRIAWPVGRRLGVGEDGRPALCAPWMHLDLPSWPLAHHPPSRTQSEDCGGIIHIDRFNLLILM